MVPLLSLRLPFFFLTSKRTHTDSQSVWCGKCPPGDSDASRDSAVALSVGKVADWWPRGGGLVAPRRLESDKNLSKSAQNLLGSAQDLLGPATEFQSSVTR